jgi:hypothetical protein
MKPTSLRQLSPEAFKTHPVWEFTNADPSSDDAEVRPVGSVPVAHLVNRIVGTQVRLANGEHRWAILGNVDVRKVRSTYHLLTCSVLVNGRWFYLARYHDVGQAEHGPSSLAAALQLSVDEVFPMSYDIRALVSEGDPNAQRGAIDKEPTERLSDDEIMDLVLE